MAQKTLSMIIKMVDQASDRFDRIMTASDRLTQKLNSMGAYGDMAFESMQSAADKAAAAMDSVTPAMDEYTDMISEAEQAMQQTTGATSDMGDEFINAGNGAEEMASGVNESVGALENLMMAVGATKMIQTLGEGLQYAADKAIEFESAMTGVFKTVDGTEAQLAAITQGVRDMALQIPATTTEIAGVAEVAGQLGIATNDVMDFTEIMIALGETTNLAADVAATSIARMANITGLDPANYENFASTIVALGNNFATTEAEITAMATRMASSATIAGFSETQILALAASLSSVGIEAEAGGSAMARMISDMQSAVETGSDRLEEFANVAGMTAEQFSGLWGVDAVEAMYAFIDGLDDVERHGKTATVILEEMGITEVRLSNAIKSLANDNEGLRSAIDMANQAWDENAALANEAALRYGTLESKLQLAKNATDDFATSWGQALTPTVGVFADVWTNLMTGFSAFIQEHPAVAQALTAVGIGFGAATVAVAGYTVATKIAQAATEALKASMSAIFWPVTLITATVAALVIFGSATENAVDKTEELTYASQDMENRLNDLTVQYDELSASSNVAETKLAALHVRISELNKAFEQSSRTVRDLIVEVNQLAGEQWSAVAAYDDKIASIRDEELTTIGLIDTLADLSAQNNKTAEDYMRISALIDEIVSKVPGLEGAFNQITGAMNLTPAEMVDIAKSDYAAQQYEADYEELKRVVGAEDKLRTAYFDAAIERNARIGEYRNVLQEMESLRDVYEDAASNLPEYGPLNNESTSLYQLIYGEGVETNEVNPETGEKIWRNLTESVKIASDAYHDNQEAIDALSTSTAEWTQQNGEAWDSMDIGQRAIESTSMALAELAQAWDEAYASSLEAVRGTFGLLDEYKRDVEITTDAVLKAWQSQTEAWADYNKNLEILENAGVSHDLVLELSTGGIENMNIVAAIAESISGADGVVSDEVDKINEAWNGLYRAETAVSGTMANIQTNFDSKFNEILNNTNGSMNAIAAEFDVSDETYAAGERTMNSFASSLESGFARAQGIVDAKMTALKNTFNSFDFSLPDLEGNATGTVNSSWAYLAGERGPELIMNAPGSQVFTAGDTSRIMANALDYANGESNEPLYTPAAVAQGEDADSAQLTHKSELTIHVDVGGKVSTIGGNVDVPTVVAEILDELEPALASRIEAAKNLEGDGAYEY